MLVLAGAIVAAAHAARADVQGDPRDQSIVGFAVNQALEFERSGIPIPWANPETNRRGTIVLEPATYPRPDGPCRAYRRTIERPGFTTAEIRGNACRLAPAVWSVEETIVTAAVAITPPTAAAATQPPASPSLPRKAAPTKSESGRALEKNDEAPAVDAGTAKADAGTARPAPPRSKPSLPDYTLPSKAGS
jgi:hypothetical protein